MPGNESLPLLNVFEINDDQGVTHHLLAFIEPVRAGSSGIASRSIVGEIRPTQGDGYDPSSLKLNPEFIEAFTDYMNEVQATAPEITDQAKGRPSGWVYIIDPRHVEQAGEEFPAADLVGAFAVDEAGQVVPKSFQYNANHTLIDPDRGMTGLFHDRRFYDWLHRVQG
jgi:hypothetical protein